MHVHPLVLLVHDGTPDMGSGLELRKAGYDVSFARGAEDARRLMQGRGPDDAFDVVIVDVDPAGHAGLSLLECDSVRQGRTAVLALTGLESPGLADHVADRVGSVLERPYDAEDLCRAVAGLLTARQTRGRDGTGTDGPSGTRHTP